MARTKASEDKNFPTLDMALRKYLASGESSDMKIKCGDTVHNVHRVIVCGQSSFLTNAMKTEHNFKEAQTNTVELHDEYPTIVQAAINFMYHQHRELFDGEIHKLVGNFLTLYSFADRYGIGGLREHCAQEIEKLLDVDDFSPKLFLYSVDYAYAHIPENDDILHGILVQIASKNLAILSYQPEFLNVVEAAGRFGAAVLKKLGRSEQVPTSPSKAAKRKRNA